MKSKVNIGEVQGLLWRSPRFVTEKSLVITEESLVITEESTVITEEVQGKY
jgi:hypothetical protein